MLYIGRKIKPAMYITVLFAALSISSFNINAADKKAYGVFVGLNRNKIEKLYNYEQVIIDAQGYTKSDIKKLHKKGVKVYSYLNIGSLETYRSYYNKYKKYCLKQYDNWEDEYWIDVSKRQWRSFIVNKIAKKINNKGVDGFFIDNADVYYLYPKKEIYSGVKSILKQLKSRYNKEIIINGGDTFVKKVIKTEKNIDRIFDGVNQECVFTKIDFDSKSFGNNSKSDRKYYLNYLRRCKRNKIDIYLTEYAKTRASIRKVIADYCKKNNYKYYVSRSLNLN